MSNGSRYHRLGAGCGVGVPQGRRGSARTFMRRRRHLPRASGGASAAPSRAALFPAARIMGPSPELGREPAARGLTDLGRTETRRRPPRRAHPTRSWYHRLVPVAVSACRKGAGVCTEPYMRRHRHLFLAPGGGGQRTTRTAPTSAPPSSPSRTPPQRRRPRSGGRLVVHRPAVLVALTARRSDLAPFPQTTPLQANRSR